MADLVALALVYLGRIKMKWNTFDGWQEEGMFVMKGEKSILRCPITGLPLFNENQVSEPPDNDMLFYDEYWKD